MLNEVDWGLQRTNYRFVAAELAATLGMNFAYGVEFVEVDPVLLGLSPHPLAPREETLAKLSAADRIEAEAALTVDKARYLGLHGNAILSRYPLENVRAIPYRFQGHDWYTDEKKKISEVEKGRREASELAFHEEISRQVRRGGRMMLLAEIVDPDLPAGRALIVATHIEDVTKPKNRVEQLKELLAIVRAARHPVILAGDMNTSGHDISPLTVGRLIRRQLGNKRFWLLEAAKMEVRGGPFLDVVLGGVDLVRTEDDPTVTNIPTLFGNPEANFFRVLPTASRTTIPSSWTCRFKSRRRSTRCMRFATKTPRNRPSGSSHEPRAPPSGLAEPHHAGDRHHQPVQRLER